MIFFLSVLDHFYFFFIGKLFILHIFTGSDHGNIFVSPSVNSQGKSGSEPVRKYLVKISDKTTNTASMEAVVAIVVGFGKCLPTLLIIKMWVKFN